MGIIDRLRIPTKLLLAFGAVGLIILAMNATVLVLIGKTRAESSQMSVLAQSETAIRSAMLEQTNGMRAFLLLPSDKYRSRDQDAQKAYASALKALEEAAADQPQLREQVAQMKAAAADWRAQVGDEMFRLSANPATLPAARDLVVSGPHAKMFDAYRARLDQVAATIQDLEKASDARQAAAVDFATKALSVPAPESAIATRR